MSLLITGICGFAGSVIARELLAHQSGLRIVGLDNLIRKGSETNVEPLRAWLMPHAVCLKAILGSTSFRLQRQKPEPNPKRFISR